MKRMPMIILGLSAACGAMASCQSSGESPLNNPLQYPPKSIVYKTVPAPPGALLISTAQTDLSSDGSGLQRTESRTAVVQIAVLEGNPRSAGLYTVRLKAPPGFFIGPHTHPSHERVTVLAGEMIVGFGQSASPAAMAEALNAGAIRYPAGSYYVNPKDEPHFLWTGQKGVTVQITGFGPWKVEPLSN